MRWYGLNWSCSGHKLVECYCKHSNEQSGLIKGWKILDYLSKLWLLKKDSKIQLFQETTRSRWKINCTCYVFLPASCFAYTSTLKMEVICFSETSDFLKTSCVTVPKNNNSIVTAIRTTSTTRFHFKLFAVKTYNTCQGSIEPIHFTELILYNE
jgi:hypothetical protein